MCVCTWLSVFFGSVLNLWEYGKNHLISGWLIINPSKTIGSAHSYFYHMACCHGSSPASNKEVQRFNDVVRVLIQT